MKRLFTISVTFIVIAVGIGLFVGYRNNQQTADEQNQSRVTTNMDGKTTASQDSGIPGSYIDYSEASVANAAGTRLLFFYAPWCPQCRQLDEDIKNNTIPGDVTIIKTDYDSNQDLRKKYGVTLQTTVVKLDANGNAADKYVAYNEPTLDNVIKNLVQ